MNLEKILVNLNYELVQGSINKSISLIASNHEHTVENALFVAIKGFNHDGHDFIQNVIDRGASVIVLEEVPTYSIDPSITIIKVKNSRKALALISDPFFGSPSSSINMIGITGTNGKTSTSYFLESILTEANSTVGKIGTTGIYINNVEENIERTTVTTPDIIDMQQILKRMESKNVDFCVMEVSSHALLLHRVSGISYHTSLFTNLSQEHLELHNNLDEYFETKAKLFDLTRENNIINIDDPYGEKLAHICQGKKSKTYTVGIDQDADFMASNINYTLEKTSYILKTPTYQMEIEIDFPGKINVYNSLMAIAAAYVNNISRTDISKGLSKMKQIPGRFELVYEKDDFKVMIDFAHTKDALENLLKMVKPFVKGRLILVFGVYADLSEQGREKRLSMGQVAGKYADLAIITLDNPKHFDQNLIVEQIEKGVKSSSSEYKTILDREEAIKYAIKQSTNSDIVVIAGKGHETTQIINGQELYLNEREIVLNTLKEMVL